MHTMLSMANHSNSNSNNNNHSKRLGINLFINIVLLTSTAITTTTCFSTQASVRNARPAASSMRAAGARRDESQSAGNSYTANYITAIENNFNCARQSGSGADGAGGASGAGGAQQAFFVATTDHNYAIYSPCLLDRGWRSVTVNGDQVFVLKDDNRVFSTSLYKLDELQRDLIAEVRSNFTENLAGLKFSRYTSGTSTHLPPAQHAAPALGSANGCTGPSVAASAISRLLVAGGASSNHRKAPVGHDKRGNRVATQQARSQQAHTRTPPPTTKTGAHCSMSQSKSACTPNRGDTLNYYNLHNRRLNTTLGGDVYFMDFHCNILDVYSTTVSLLQLTDMSILYRDSDYFSVSRSNLPLAINRFFFVNEQVFFVYNDGSVLVKAKWQLDKTELDTVMYARNWLAATAKWQDKAANLGSRGAESRH